MSDRRILFVVLHRYHCLLAPRSPFLDEHANFSKLAGLCSSAGRSYAPAEEELKPDSLAALATALAAANAAVTRALTAYSNALIARDRLLYHDDTGLLARIETMRAYFESAFGTGSPERKLLKGLNIRTLRNRRLAAV